MLSTGQIAHDFAPKYDDDHTLGCMYCVYTKSSPVHQGAGIVADIDDVDAHMTRVPTDKQYRAMGTPHTYVLDHSVNSNECVQCGRPESYQDHYTKSETIADEASRIVYGDREKAYDDPNVNFERIAHMWTGTLLRKLLPGVAITAGDVALCLVQLKIAREAHKPSRDNRVDGVGYFLCLDRIVESKKDE